MFQAGKKRSLILSFFFPCSWLSCFQFPYSQHRPGHLKLLCCTLSTGDMLWFVLVVSMIHAINGFSTALFAIHHPSRSSRCSLRNLHARPKRAATEPTIITSSLQIPTSKITERLLQLTSNPNIAILVDAENIRGKTNFELTHADLLDRLMVWSSLRNHAYGRCIVVIDHGSKPTAHSLSQLKGYGICVTFSGPNQKADDVIARDTQWLLNQTDVSQVIVITADRELSFRFVYIMHCPCLCCFCLIFTNKFIQHILQMSKCQSCSRD